MQLTKTNESPTKVKLTVSAYAKELQPLKAHTLTHFQGKVKVPGFRAGKIPVELLEKHVDPQALQTEFLEEALQSLYTAAAKELKLRPVDQPQVTLKKFVPFTSLEFEVTVDVIGDIKLADYTKIKKTRPTATATDKDVDEVIESLRKQLAEKKDIDRAAKEGDQIWIDFRGVDAQTKEPIKGADGKDYPLILGSNTFIPGFEPELIGLSAGQDKTFTLTFPKDYGAQSLAGKKATFTVNATKVQEMILPNVDDAFAVKVGPFKALAELKSDIKTQLAAQKQQQLDRDFESELVKELTDKSHIEIPEVLLNDQVERLLYDLRQNLTYRGQTMQGFLETQGKTEEQYRTEVLKPEAEARIKASLLLAEIADKEQLTVTPEEAEIRLQLLKKQHKDEKMQAELNKPEALRDIGARLLTEKTLNKLVTYATKK